MKMRYLLFVTMIYCPTLFCSDTTTIQERLKQFFANNLPSFFVQLLYPVYYDMLETPHGEILHLFAKKQSNVLLTTKKDHKE